MPSALSTEAFLPCLLDRLTDQEPEKPRESFYRQTLTIQHYRQSVLRDLGWLMNSPSHRSADGFEFFPEVLSSTLNYGTPDLCGRTASSLIPQELENQISECIVKFEPRILKESLVVKIQPGVNKSSPNVIGFEIRGMMWANPLPEQFYLSTQIDLETGECDF